MKNLITLVILSITISGACFGSHEKKPIVPKPIKILSEPQRQEMLRATRALPVCNGPCSLNPAFAENMEKLLVADEKSYNLACCFGMGTQRCMYEHGCTCEHPCAYICAAGCAGLLIASGMIIGVSTGAIAANTAYPVGFFEGIPSGMLCLCGLLEECTRCKSSSENQLDYITDPKNFIKKGADNNNSSDFDVHDFGYDSGYDS